MNCDYCPKLRGNYSRNSARQATTRSRLHRWLRRRRYNIAVRSRKASSRSPLTNGAHTSSPRATQTPIVDTCWLIRVPASSLALCFYAAPTARAVQMSLGRNAGLIGQLPSSHISSLISPHSFLVDTVIERYSRDLNLFDLNLTSSFLVDTVMEHYSLDLNLL